MARRRDVRSHCPINFSLELFGDPWSLLILRDILFLGKRRFREFLASEERIASNILADRLVRLVRANLLLKTGRLALYQPTASTLDLIPMLVELSAWGARHDPKTAAPPFFLKAFAKDKERLVREMRRAAESGRPWLPKK